MQDRFAESVVLVTGAAGDIGRAVCEAFERRDARVYATDCAPCDRARFIPGDLADPAFPRHCVERVLAEAGRIDILVLNAGICPRTPLTEIGREEWERVLAVNLTSAFLLGQACLEAMMKDGAGAIVTMCSMAGQVGGLAVGAHYSASKAALTCLTKSMARQGALRGVRANAVTPGVIDTSMTTAVDDQSLAALRSSIPLGRFGTPQEVAAAVLFLASPEASFITGATLNVNGGQYMGA